jgi:hypothetical protein
MLASILWCAAVLIFALWYMNIDWTFSADHMVHVKFSNTETWDYPKELGLERIRDAIKAQIDRKNQERLARIASLPEDKKACVAGNSRFDSTLAAVNQALQNNILKDECQKIFWDTAGEYAVPTDWEYQLANDPISFGRAMRSLAPWLLGPPLLLLGLGAAFFWALAGFRHSA